MLTILFYRVFFPFLIIDLQYLIPEIGMQVFNPTAELALPIQISSKEAKAEIKTHPVTAEISTIYCSM